MNSLFARTLAAFLVALALLVGLLGGLLSMGFSRSIRAWGREKTGQYERIALRLLRGESAALGMVPEETPFFVYDAAKQLVYSNRGEGRHRAGSGASELIPLYDGDRLAGYFFAGGLHFADDAANRRFLDSLYRMLWIAVAASTAISVVFAFFFSRGLSLPVRQVADALDRIATGERTRGIPERGATEIASLARSANRLSARLAREEQLRSQWVQDIAHDLRTPISALKAQFEGMYDGVLAPTRERIEKNIREISRLEGLVGDLEELVRLESPETVAHPEQVDMREVLTEVVERFAAQAAAKRVAVSVEGESLRMAVDVKLMNRALVNCLANAVRHVDEGGRIEVGGERRGSLALLWVANTGTVIPEADRERVFDRLYRGEAARSSPGSGLGLTIAKRIVELHRGTIRAVAWRENSREQGTRIEMELPLS